MWAITIGLCPCNKGWSKAGWWWDGTQSIISPSELWNNHKNSNLVRSFLNGENITFAYVHHKKNITYAYDIFWGETKCIRSLKDVYQTLTFSMLEIKQLTTEMYQN